MPNQEVLAKLQLEPSNTVGELYTAAANYVDDSINGISETMRGTVLHVKSVIRGMGSNHMRTVVRVGGSRHLPFAQDELITRWEYFGTEGDDRPIGSLVHTSEMLAGKARLYRLYPEGKVEATAPNGPRGVVSELYNQTISLDSLEPHRRIILLAATDVILAHAMAVEQINEGVNPAAAIVALRHPGIVALSSANA